MISKSLILLPAIFHLCATEILRHLTEGRIMVDLQDIPRENRSDVARLTAAINAEYATSRQGLSGLAQGSGQHAFITRRMENIAELHAELRTLVGDETMRKIDLELDLVDNDQTQGKTV